MAVMTPEETWPLPGRPLTVGDLERMPDDGRRYELLDGVLTVSPAPFNDHQLVVARLLSTLSAECPPGYMVLPAPGVQLTDTTQVEPDVVVARAADYRQRYLDRAPRLAVEVLSRSTALVDRNLKKAAYEKHGIASYWIVSPDREKPWLTAYELADGRYVEVGHAVADGVVEPRRPFPVRIVPADLTDLPGAGDP